MTGEETPTSRTIRKATARAGAFLALWAFASTTAVAARQTPQQQGGPQRVDSITVTGNVRVQSQSIVSTFGVQPGTSITYRDIQRGIKALHQTGDFTEVTVRLRGTAPAVLTLDVQERPTLRRVVINGLENASERAVRDTTGLRPGTPYNPQRVIEAKAFIRAELADEGIPFAVIADRVSPVEDGDNAIDVILDVTEGNRVTVAQVDVIGNERLTDGDILGAMRTRPEGFWWFRSGSFDELEYGTDLGQSLPNLYRSRGYLDFRVVSDTVVIDPASGKARIEVVVEEGPQYRLASFTINGNSHFTDEQLRPFFGESEGGLLGSLGFGGEAREQSGRVFDAVAFNEAVATVREQYANDGYLYAQVNPVFTRREAENGDGPTVEASWEIQEGAPAIVNRVSISGNEYTYEWVIRNQILVLPGDVYSQAMVLRSYQNISALGFFEAQMPFPQIEPTSNGDVNITFNVVEKQTGTLNFGTSVGGGVGLSGFIGYSHPNLFGQAKSGSLRWDFGRFLNSFELSYTDPALFQSLVSGSISLFNSRDRFIQFSTGRRRRIGTNVRFGFPYPGSRFTRLFVGYGISRTRYELFSDVDDTSLFGLPPGIQSQLTVGLTRQTLDHPMFPTTGSRQTLNFEVNGGVLGGDGNFTRILTDNMWWAPVGRLGGSDGGTGGIQFALGLTLEGGAVLGDARAFPFDRFWMGGVQFGQGLRGYEETTITPLGFFVRRDPAISEIDRLGNVFLRTSTEFAMRLGGQLSVSAFYDAGNVWQDPGDFDPTRLFRGAGMGVQIVTPFGPIGLDYAYGFDKPEPGWRLHFKMGPGF